ncbi:HSPB1-associated protein 1-like [Teleopsis dalmanni]|uniref:HSPB1-associated protein 1-like n=1 Tax=Teleopsis dalmanni TaxID=139649 RepID=UPI0018CDDDEB|nr:HSPB1-associated protein 1-like [Teleopsis dalmanni]
MAEGVTETECEERKYLRELILNVHEPVVLRNFKHNWKAFDCSFLEWCQKFDAATGGDQQTFSCMTHRDATPQWERNYELIKITAENFANTFLTEQKFWAALMYKRANELPSVCTEGVNFECFGFPKSSGDVNLWLCSPGANTPCHYDTYGCNIVVQVYGSKSWLLFPPNTPLTSTRIPYEESSVYCTENFHSPDLRNISQFKKLESYAHRCILNPGDVLIVPHHWWHYAEAVETCLSVNYWVSLKKDIEIQLEEAIVKYIMESSVKDMFLPEAQYIFNPNQISETIEQDILWNKMKWLLDKASALDDNNSSQENETYHNYQYLPQSEIDQYSEKGLNVYKVPTMTDGAFMDLISENAKRFDMQFADESDSPLHTIKEIMLNSICSANVIKVIKLEFYRRYAAELLN